MRSTFRRGVVIGAALSMALVLTTPTLALAKDSLQRTRVQSAPACTAKAPRIGASRWRSRSG